ncbi:GTP-binding protein [Streptomyces tubbatahanensis]|uniref:GTP-binding protein n=1 Tax=Streptomyces tubbatahanensis TaxID=2923272 RepID=A0ABY3XMT3_9ACTN|nr:GTP-binding protein [Streptomyces tubbatahanensis]UNS95705.1 GTP-binding protein [Streptomyces tubbatahanensis]
MSAYTRPHPLPHLTIGTLGPRGHGKTTLARALSAAGPCPCCAGPDLDRRRFGYATDTRRYTVLDPADDPDRLDGALLVVSVLEGARTGTAAHLARARRTGLLPLVVALTKADQGSDELTDLVEADVRALLTAHGHAGETLPAVRVSALGSLAGDSRWRGATEALLDAVDTYVPLPGGGEGLPLPGNGEGRGGEGRRGPCDPRTVG